MQAQPSVNAETRPVSIRPLRQDELPAADRICRLAFGTFLGLPDPMQFAGDADYVRTRWLADPTAAFGAEVEGELVGSNFATNWGSVGFFGPLTVHPQYWERGIASRLMEPVVQLFSDWGITQAGLFTFAHSPKHLYLYQKFGFWPRFLTAIMSRPVAPVTPGAFWTRYSQTPDGEQSGGLSACRTLTNTLFEGLDVHREIQAVRDQQLGDTVLLWDHSQLVGLAVCHCGPGSEAGSDTCYVKFGAVLPGPQAPQNFDRLLDACNALAAEQGLNRLVAGVNTARHEAYRQMLAYGFRSDFQGVVMQKPNTPGYNRPGIYLIDDWR
ncbi:MAG TPA: GNAT family N-acetyltransferase [Chthonomonadaceae bacterium]|nr:GNAT family N-acetyltransferase [Chthonomonadaceae bacterium]